MNIYKKIIDLKISSETVIFFKRRNIIMVMACSTNQSSNGTYRPN